jgi:hypothetical protein
MKDLGQSTTFWGSPSSAVPRACSFTSGSTPSTSLSALAWPNASPARPRWTRRARSLPPVPRSPIQPATGALSGPFNTSSSPGLTSPTPSSRCASTCTTLGSCTSPRLSGSCGTCVAPSTSGSFYAGSLPRSFASTPMPTGRAVPTRAGPPRAMPCSSGTA